MLIQYYDMLEQLEAGDDSYKSILPTLGYKEYLKTLDPMFLQLVPDKRKSIPVCIYYYTILELYYIGFVIPHHDFSSTNHWVRIMNSQRLDLPYKIVERGFSYEWEASMSNTLLQLNSDCQGRKARLSVLPESVFLNEDGTLVRVYSTQQEVNMANEVGLVGATLLDTTAKYSTCLFDISSLQVKQRLKER